MKQLGIAFFALLLASTLVAAASFTVEVAPVKDRILIDGIAEFKLTIHNLGPVTAKYVIDKVDYPRWDIRTPDNINPITIDIPAGGSGTLTLYLDPNQNYIGGRGSHSVNIGVQNLASGETVMVRANVGITDDTKPAYTPTVILTTDFPDEVQPSQDLRFTVTLSNQNKLNLTDVVLRISSKLMDSELVIDLAAEQETMVDVRVPLNPQTPPLADTAYMTLTWRGDSVLPTPFQKTYRVAPAAVLSQSEAVKKSFLRTGIEVTFRNNGNVPHTGELTVAVNGWKRPFLYTKPEANYRRGAFTWDATIPAGESVTVTVVENYLWLLVLIIVVGLAWALIHIKRLPIAITKKITQVESKEGSLVGMKVLVTVRNRSQEKLEEVVVLEKLPKLLELERGATIGSLPPTKIFKNERQETFVKWELAALGPDEERVVNYSLRSSFEILGGLKLTPAVVTAKSDGKEIKALSQAPAVNVRAQA